MLAEPYFWRHLTGFFGVDDANARRWWEALSAAEAPVAQAWRRAIGLCDDVENPSPAAIRAFLILQVPPAQVIDVLEVLVEEGLLPRWRATKLEDKILACMSARGTWR